MPYSALHKNTCSPDFCRQHQQLQLDVLQFLAEPVPHQAMPQHYGVPHAVPAEPAEPAEPACPKQLGCLDLRGARCWM